MSVTGQPATVFPSGVSTSPGNYVFNNLPFPTPMRLASWFDDFVILDTDAYTVTNTNSGTVALATSSCNGGKVIMTSGATTGNVAGVQLVTKTFAFTSGSQMWFSCNFSLTDATVPAWMCGLSNDFTALTPTDGVYFSKAAASAAMTLVIRASSTSTTLAIGTVADATFYTFSFYYDARANVPTLYGYSTIPYATSAIAAPTAFGQPYFNGGQACVASANSLGGLSGSSLLTNLPGPTVLLTAGMGVKAGSGVAKVATCDYLYAAEEIVARY